MYNRENNYENKKRLYSGNKNPASKFSAFFFEWLECIVQAVIIVVVVMTFLCRVVNVSGTSMLDTLYDSDKVVVIKWSYSPKNGDVVVISRGENLNEPLIKRIIATEGQTLDIDFTKGSVTVDGVTLDETYIKEPMWLQGDGEIPSVVPTGYCFVMGDNRNRSMDSRFKEVGLIKNENIVGRASFVIFPFSRLGVIN